jgi:two-component system response regulator YesN
MAKELFESCANYCEHLAGLSGASWSILDLRDEPAIIDRGCSDSFCSGCMHEKRNELRTHSYGINEAYRWGGKYIYYCPLGLVFVASSLSDKSGKLLGGLVLGPMVMGILQDFLQEFAYTAMRPELSKLPVLDTRQVRHLSEILSAVTVAIAGNPHSKLGQIAREQERLMNTIYSVRREYGNGNSYRYPIETESSLCAMMASGDKDGAQQLLEELLGHIFFYSAFDLDEIKARSLELIAVLSRAAIEAGANMSEILRFSTSSIQGIEKFDGIDQIGIWLKGIVQHFISSTFEYVKIKHSDIVYKVMEFTKNNYADKLSLDELARHVFLSKSYLSTVFKEETGIGISVYINKVRIEKSNALLSGTRLSISQIAQLCGFEDQSYFSRVFKKQTGISPKKYRDSLAGISRQ